MATYDIAALSTALEFDTTRADSKCVVKIPGVDKIAIAWTQTIAIKLVQVFNVNTTTGAITAVGTPFDIETSSGGGLANGISLVAIDASNLAVFWNGAGASDGDGFTRLLSVDGTGNVTANGSVVEYATNNGLFACSVLMDSTHILSIWSDADRQGNAAIFTVNTGLGAIVLTGVPVVFGTYSSGANSTGSIAKLSSTKAVVFFSSTANDGFARVLDINTTTWAVTNAGAAFEYLDAASIIANSVVAIDTAGSPMRVINGYIDLTADDSETRSYSIDTSTWAITNFGASALDLATDGGNLQDAIRAEMVDSTHVVFFYVGSGNDGFARVVTYSSSDGSLSNTANEIEFDTNSFDLASSCAFESTPGFFVAAWRGLDDDGFVQAFQVTMGGGGGGARLLTLLGVGT